jgi:hypothetical protein
MECTHPNLPKAISNKKGTKGEGGRNSWFYANNQHCPSLPSLVKKCWGKDPKRGRRKERRGKKEERVIFWFFAKFFTKQKKE